MKKYLTVLRRIVLVILGLSAIADMHTIHAETIHYVQSSTPTIFVHGWGSSSRAEEKMVNAARSAGVTKTVVKANVDRKGNVTFSRQLPAKAVNPIVEVNLEDNKLAGYGKHGDYVAGYHHGGTYVKDVIVALQRQYSCSTVNLVGHSMGNLEIINYVKDNYDNNKLPQISHLVALAGHYNGLVGQPQAEQVRLSSGGKPDWMDPTYQELLSLRKTFPRETKVLNIYGDLGDGSHSDGDVPVNSAKALKYLLAGRAKSYREVEITGKDAQHSKLHNNSQVNHELINFLWTTERH
ncbi:alpha/beta hydrolase [Limosilactobacillus caccae]|uniref:alpha/beta hydrolase n=1 Tax=Limosilactobacillus caccae TaxID=1926284 RepID=UPI0009710821|nr:alpha/beta hydrolase [Limosilactobacillus caccae]